MKDIFALPDYQKFFSTGLERLSNCWSKHRTKLQWLFVKVERGDEHPNGVNVYCRRFSDPSLNFDQIEEDLKAKVILAKEIK